MTLPLPSYFRALPPYLGGKRRLCPLIFSLVQRFVPRERWPMTFLDPMCGSGAVALSAKAFGFEVIASDIAARGGVVARALIANDTAKLSKQDVLDLFGNVGDAEYPLPDEVAAVLTPAQAGWFRPALAAADRCLEPWRSLRRLLLVKLLLRLYPLSLPSATDAAAAVCGDHDAISPRRLGHYMRARGLLSPDHVWRVAQELNLGVFGGYGSARQTDACFALTDTSPDVVYLDPPYPGTSRYEQVYMVVDRFLGDQRPKQPAPTLDELLAAAEHIPYLVLSYGGPNATLPDLVSTVERYRRVATAREIPYRHLQSISSEAKNAGNRELLVVARH